MKGGGGEKHVYEPYLLQQRKGIGESSKSTFEELPFSPPSPFLALRCIVATYLWKNSGAKEDLRGKRKRKADTGIWEHLQNKYWYAVLACTIAKYLYF